MLTKPDYVTLRTSLYQSKYIIQRVKIEAISRKNMFARRMTKIRIKIEGTCDLTEVDKKKQGAKLNISKKKHK